MIIKNKSSRNILTLMTGSTIAQAIPIAISPILTRLYTPEDFGVLALFTSLVTIFSVISTGRYEFAIMLPKKRVKCCKYSSIITRHCIYNINFNIANNIINSQ